jgi:hypothetical protein
VAVRSRHAMRFHTGSARMSRGMRSVFDAQRTVLTVYIPIKSKGASSWCNVVSSCSVVSS